MKNLSIIVLLLLVPILSIAQSSIFKGASLTIGHLEQELDEFVWGETEFMNFPVEMHGDTLTVHYPYQTTRYINGEYRVIDEEVERWASVDDRGNSCYIFLIDSEDATWVKIEYSDRSYIIEIQLYEDDHNDVPSSSF